MEGLGFCVFVLRWTRFSNTPKYNFNNNQMGLPELFSRGEEEKTLKNIVSCWYIFKMFYVTFWYKGEKSCFLIVLHWMQVI